MAMSVASFGIMLFVFSLFIGNIKLAGVFGFENPSVYASLVAFGFLYAPVSFATGVFGAWLSRKNEYEADRFAVTTYLHGGDFIAALKKLSVENLSNLTPHPWKVMLEYSHPPVMERIAAIRKISPVQPPES
jgi:STE24 endopeptidase